MESAEIRQQPWRWGCAATTRLRFSAFRPGVLQRDGPVEDELAGRAVFRIRREIAKPLELEAPVRCRFAERGFEFRVHHVKRVRVDELPEILRCPRLRHGEE